MSSRQRTVTKPTIIDPLFQIPQGAEDDFVYADTNRNGTTEEFLSNNGFSPVNSIYGTLYSDSPLSGNGPVPLGTPSNLVIFDQKIRRANGGVVVDITTQFDDVPNAQRYEMRVTKI